MKGLISIKKGCPSGLRNIGSIGNSLNWFVNTIKKHTKQEILIFLRDIKNVRKKIIMKIQEKKEFVNTAQKN